MFELRALLLLRSAPERTLHRFVLFLVMALVLRSAALAFGILDIDEAHWTLIGRLLSEGATPYVDVSDHKPPLLFYVFALFGAATGGSLAGQVLLMMAYVASTATLLSLAARRLGADAQGAFMGGWAYLVLTTCNVITVNSELLSELPVAAGLLVLAGGFTPGRLFACGVLAGLAPLLRPQAAIFAVAVGVVCAWQLFGLRARGAWRTLLAFVAGCALPVAATLTLFAAAGLLAPFWEWNVTRNLGYPAPAGWVWLALTEGGIFLIFAQGWAWAAAYRPCLEALRGLRARDPRLLPAALVLPVLLLLAVLAVGAGRRFYSHYFLQTALPLSLLAGPRIASLWRDARLCGQAGRARLFAAAVAVPLLVFFAAHWGRGALGHYPSQDPQVAAIAEFLRGPSAPPGPIAVWGDPSHLYLYANRRPASRFYNAAPLVGNFDSNHVADDFDVASHVSHADVATYIADLERNRAAILVDTSSARMHFWQRFALERVPQLREYVARTFTLGATVAGARLYFRQAPRAPSP